jgi:hypothetical protein
MQPLAEPPPAGDRVEDAGACRLGIEAELHVDERAALRLGEQPVRIGAGVQATQRQLAAVVHAFDRHIGLDDPHGRLEHLSVAAALLEPLAVNVDHTRPPFRVPLGVPDELPERIRRNVDVGLQATGGHQAGARDVTS